MALRISSANSSRAPLVKPPTTQKLTSIALRQYAQPPSARIGGTPNYGPGATGPGVSTAGMTFPAVVAPAAPGGGGGYAPAPAAPSGGGGGGGSSAVMGDFFGDPILQQVMAAGNAAISAREASTNDQMRQALIGLGSRDLASKYFSSNDPLLATISEDPNTSVSVLGKLNHQKILDLAGVDNTNAAQNTFFGTARTHDLDEANRNILFQREGAIGATSSQIAQMQQALADYKWSVLQSILQAEGDAYTRSLAAGYGRGGGGSGGGDSGGGGQLAEPTVATGLGPQLVAVQGDQLGGGYRRPGGF